MKTTKQLTLLIALLFAGPLFAQQETEKINWITFNEAIAKSKKEPRNIMIDFYTKWCGPCRMMDRYTFNDPTVAGYINKYFYAVKFNAEGNEEVTLKGKKYTNPNFDKNRSPKMRNATHQVTGHLGIRGYPTALFLDKEQNVLKAYSGFRQPNQFLPILKSIASSSVK